MRGIVVVFAKAPRLGTVKRRLAAGIGARAAWRFHRDTLRRTLLVLSRDRRFSTVLSVTPDRARGPWTLRVAHENQGSGDLGQRMARAFARRPHRRVAIVGSDIPGLTADLVAQALHLLGRARVVVGPAEDGGYWLIALGPRRPAGLFDDVRWSGPHALADTLRTVSRPGGGPVARIATLRDVDDAEDFAALPRQRGHR